MAGILLPDCGILMGTRKHKLWASVSRDLHQLKKIDQKAQHMILFVSIKFHFNLSFCDKFYFVNKSNFIKINVLKLLFKHLCIIFSLIFHVFLNMWSKEIFNI